MQRLPEFFRLSMVFGFIIGRRNAAPSVWQAADDFSFDESFAEKLLAHIEAKAEELTETSSVLLVKPKIIVSTPEVLHFELMHNGSLLHSLELVQVDDDLVDKQVFETKPKKCHFKTDVTNLKTTAASVSNCDGTLRGIVFVEGNALVLQPLPEQVFERLTSQTAAFDSQQQSTEAGSVNSDWHILYRRDVSVPLKKLEEFCGVSDVRMSFSQDRLHDFYDDDMVEEDSRIPLSRKVKSLDTNDVTVELAIFVDSELYNKYYSKYGNDAENKLQDYIMTIVNNIQTLYHQSTLKPLISFRVVHYEVFRNQPYELGNSMHYGEAIPYLNAFCLYQKEQKLRTWDHSLLFTGYNLHTGGETSISGISRLRGMCDPANACTLAEALDFSAAFIATHELGHSFGMKHDEQSSCTSDYIMSGQLGSGKVTWSSCSQYDYQQFLYGLDQNGKNCLLSSITHNVPAAVIGSKMPGQSFSADQQCEMMHGDGYIQVTPPNDHEQGICYMMWCGLSKYGKIITSHPALEGTRCNEQKYCKLGKCVSWSEATNDLPKPVDGKWSQWSEMSCGSGCYCSPVKDSVGVMVSRRACNNPTPVNGGADCPGGSNRALICSKSCPNATQTVKEYIDSVCKNRQGSETDIRGVGRQLKKDNNVCKVSCEVRIWFRLSYRVYADDYLPDGTPCGSNKYCIQGECLAESCGQTALLADGDSVSSCPETEICGTWSNWSDWSLCSTTCGTGTQSRRRDCVKGNCTGKANESRRCNFATCP